MINGKDPIKFLNKLIHNISLLIVLPILNSLGVITVNSDTFWVLAGIVISAEALLEIIYERRKRKLIPHEEER